MLRVGLTGSIAVGKTFVLGEFERLGCHVLDADHVARSVVEPGKPALSEIEAAFGSAVISNDGTLDRPAMATIVFADPTKRELLNSIIHPRVFEEQDAWLSKIAWSNPDDIAIIDAALMIESGGYRRFDNIVVVWCRPEVQLQRLMARSGLSEDDALRRIEAQMPQEEKKAFANHLIDTSNGFDDTRVQVNSVYHDLIGLNNVRS